MKSVIFHVVQIKRGKKWNDTVLLSASEAESIREMAWISNIHPKCEYRTRKRYFIPKGLVRREKWEKS